MLSLVKPHCMENTYFYVKETFANNITALLKTLLYLCNYFSKDGFYLKRYLTKTFNMNPDILVSLVHQQQY